mmetsp:Transcript_87261/g.182641  ORF Transcript_87261/g.182641 Transcript_87261/m.182641 type:complete len:221 (-) Transcript_87261:1386-2048(-)
MGMRQRKFVLDDSTWLPQLALPDCWARTKSIRPGRSYEEFPVSDRIRGAILGAVFFLVVFLFFQLFWLLLLPLGVLVVVRLLVLVVLLLLTWQTRPTEQTFWGVSCTYRALAAFGIACPTGVTHCLLSNAICPGCRLPRQVLFCTSNCLLHDVGEACKASQLEGGTSRGSTRACPNPNPSSNRKRLRHRASQARCGGAVPGDLLRMRVLVCIRMQLQRLG